MTNIPMSVLQSCPIDLEQERAHFKVISKIRESLNLTEILQTTIQEIRQLLAVDRVGILRLNPGEGWDEGEFIAEAVLPKFSSALAARVKDQITVLAIAMQMRIKTVAFRPLMIFMRPV